MAKKKPSVSTSQPADPPGSSLERMIGLLDLFQAGAHSWTVEQMQERLGYTRSTLYRYLKVLSDAELLTSLPDEGYVPGPRIIELDYEIRRNDPLIVVSVPVMTELVADIPSIALLCRRYRDKVLCVHQVGHPAVALQSTYERGKPQPLHYGAASRIVLANLSMQHLRRLYESQRGDFASAHLGESFEEVRQALGEIRERGWDHTVGQVTEGVTGVAAPVFDVNRMVLGSLSLSLQDRKIGSSTLSSIAERVTFCARVISQAFAGSKPR